MRVYLVYIRLQSLNTNLANMSLGLFFRSHGCIFFFFFKFTASDKPVTPGGQSASCVGSMMRLKAIAGSPRVFPGDNRWRCALDYFGQRGKH